MNRLRYIVMLCLSASSLALYANDLSTIKQRAATFDAQNIDAYVMVNIPVCDREIVGSGRYELSLPYSLRTHILVNNVTALGEGKYRILLTPSPVSLIDGPKTMTTSFTGVALLDESALVKIETFFESILEEDVMHTLGLQQAARDYVAAFIQASVAGEHPAPPYTLEVQHSNAAAPAVLPSPLCGDKAITVDLISQAHHALFGRGFLPRKPQQREEDKLFLRDAQGKMLAFAYKNASSEHAVALFHEAREATLPTCMPADDLGCKIVGGEDVLEGDSEFIVAIANRLPSGEFSQFCAGTLLSDRLVVTAAHCNTSARHYVIVGRKTINGEGGTEVKVDSVWRHVDFKKRAPYDADIAVLVLAQAIDFDALPARAIPVVTRNLTARDDVRVMGWGAKVHGGGGSEQLQFVDLDMMNDTACVDGYSDTRLPVTDNMMCASRENKDACQGDSGGGAYYIEPGIEETVYLAGIVSYGIGCSDQKYHGVYTRAYNFRDWLSGVSRALANMGGGVNEI